jgi:hypothetical protein
MSAGTLVPLEEYLARSYEPDREYGDGQIVERNVGGYLHGLFHSLFAANVVTLLVRHGFAYRVLSSADAPAAGSLSYPDVMVVPVRANPTSIILEPPPHGA